MAARRGTDPAAPRRTALAVAVLQSLRRAASTVERRLASGGHGVLGDTAALHAIAHAGELSAGDLSRLTGLTSGAVTALLDRLEGARLVVRRRSPRDRRIVLAALAPGAGVRLASMMLDMHAKAGAMLQDWPERDLLELTRLLDALGAAAGRME